MRFRALLAAVLATGALVTSVGTAAADDKPAPSTASTIAVIGDTPYGDPALARFPSDVAKINGDPDVSLVAHLGDIKNGSSVCSDSYFSQIRSIFDTFQDPLVYTPGDNEWTDCHRASAGGFLPTERLDKIRQDFFPVPGQTLGVNKTQVQSQNNGSHPYVENTMFSQSGVVFSAVNLPGSNNDLVPWFGVTPLTEGQQREFENRQEADLEWIDKAFENARENK
ncbi:MAG TPA: metallophosphoesterase family protein, partial [Acidimicrobiia bacterium]